MRRDQENADRLNALLEMLSEANGLAEVQAYAAELRETTEYNEGHQVAQNFKNGDPPVKRDNGGDNA